jgi:hypothetical protein
MFPLKDTSHFPPVIRKPFIIGVNLVVLGVVLGPICKRRRI